MHAHVLSGVGWTLTVGCCVEMPSCVPYISCGNPTCLSDVRFATIRTCQFVNPGTGVFVNPTGAYKLTKLFTHKIQQLVPLPFTLNVKNTRHFIQELKQTPLTPTSWFASLNISNMYSKVPTKESRLILEDLLSHNTVDPQTIKEVLQWYDTITQQNYFTNNGNIILQKDGLAMAAPSSGIISEFFYHQTPTHSWET